MTKSPASLRSDPGRNERNRWPECPRTSGRIERITQAADKKKIKELERDLSRKEKALAETTALLVLKKKADLIWGSGEEQ